jgi:hypothetical protein
MQLTGSQVMAHIAVSKLRRLSECKKALSALLKKYQCVIAVERPAEGQPMKIAIACKEDTGGMRSVFE